MAEINIITGNLTVSGIATFSNDAYIPSGYTNLSFFPTVGGGNLTKVYNTVYLKSDGTTTTSPGNPLATGLKGSMYYTLTNPEQISRHIRTQKFTLRTGNSFLSSSWQFSTQGFLINATGMTVPYIPSGPNEGPKYSQGITRLLTIDERLERIETSGTFALLPNERIGFGTFQPQEKVHVSGGNLRVDNTGIIENLINTNLNSTNINSINVFSSVISNTGNLYTDKLFITGSTIPTGKNSPGESGQFAFDRNYLYYCRRNNEWVRTALSEW